MRKQWVTCQILEYLWEKKTNVAKLSSKPKLCTLPPTDEALELNIKRAHYQTMVWYACLQHDPPCADPCHYGWEKDVETKTLKPVMLPSGVNTAPEQVLRNTRCNCTLSKCSSCSCAKGRIGCTAFCGCKEHGECDNPFDIRESTVVDTDDSGDDSTDESEDHGIF